MEYPDFLSYMQESVGSVVGADYNVSIHKVIKNNDIELDALTVTGKDTNVSPTIYLNNYYKEYLRGRPLGEIVYEVYGIYEENHDKVEFDLKFFTDIELVRQKLMCKLINFRTNQKLLSDVPYIQFLDFAIVFYCFISNDILGNATVLIHNDHIKLWNITAQELYECALRNTAFTLPPILTPMEDVVKDMLICELEERWTDAESLNRACEEDEYSPEEMAEHILHSMHRSFSVNMYVLTNTQQLNGSICILYENVLKNFSKKMNTDLFILPSSIHEVILIPYSEDLSPEHLNDMVNEVNSTEVEACEILSDHIYLYRRDKDCISVF